jgi:hypothetical protein
MAAARGNRHAEFRRAPALGFTSAHRTQYRRWP